MKKYALLPFNFFRSIDKDILINELGDIIVSNAGTAEKSLIDYLLTKNYINHW